MAAEARPPRVLLLTSGPLDGQEGADIQLASAVAEALSAVDFVWFSRWPQRAGRPRLSRGRAVPVLSHDGLPRLGQRLQVAAAGALLARRTDLVHAVMTIGAGYPAFSRWWPRLIGGCPVLHTVPGVMNPGLLREARPLGTTVALSDVTANALRAAGFADVWVIPPLVRLDRWPYRPRPDAAVPTVLVTGHHDPDGGADDAVSAAGVAARAGARFRLVLALRGRPGQNIRPLESELRAQAVYEGLHDVEILGYVENMRALMAASDVLLYVPRQLGGKADVPLTVLEALATGRPVILSDLHQFAALKDTVLRAPAGDSRRTGHLLRQLLDRPWWWDNLAEQGRAVVEERFGPERFGCQYAQLYRELLP